MKNIEDFENLFKEGASKASAPAPSGVWEGVSSGIGGSTSGLGSAASYFSSVSNIIKAALFVGGISAVVGILYQANTEPAPQETPTEVSETNGNDAEITSAEEVISESNPDSPLDVVSPKETNKSDAARNVATVNTASPANSGGEGGVNPDGISQNPNANDKPDGLSNPDKADMPQLILSKNSACKGDKIEIKTNVSDKGTWYANNKEIAVNTASINYTLTDDKDVDIMFKSDKRTILKTINVVNSSLAIVNEKQKDGLYNLKLNNKQTIGNWYINNRLVRTNENGISHNFKSVGKHTVKVVTVNAKCADVLEDVVEIKPMGNIFIPNVLTPDGDGKNDTYKVEIENYVKFSLQIYDLNSNLVFATNDPNIGWNGKYNNTDNQCTSGNYAGLLRYQLQGEEAKTKNIKITLITN